MKVFIGSSTQSKEDAQFIACKIEEKHHTPKCWFDEDVFIAGTYALEALENICNEVDAAIFVFNEDDTTWYRDNMVKSVRDNVLFEYGLFCGHLSRANVCFCCKGTPKIASDIIGITYIDLSHKNQAAVRIGLWLDNIKTNKTLHNTDFKVLNFLDSIQYSINKYPNIDTLRAFAINTSRSVLMLRSYDNLYIKKAEIMLRDYSKRDSFYNKDLSEQVKLATASWVQMRNTGKIRELSIRKFNFHPDAGFYIFDNSILIIGNLHFDISNNKVEFDNRVILFENTSTRGKDIINIYIDKFNRLKSNYKENEL